jgi:hypothetical protein
MNLEKRELLDRLKMLLIRQEQYPQCEHISKEIDVVVQRLRELDDDK